MECISAMIATRLKTCTDEHEKKLFAFMLMKVNLAPIDSIFKVSDALKLMKRPESSLASINQYLEPGILDTNYKSMNST